MCRAVSFDGVCVCELGFCLAVPSRAVESVLNILLFLLLRVCALYVT